MATPVADKDIRTAIAADITTVIGAGPKIYPWNCLNYKMTPDGKPDFSDWPGLFRYGTNSEFTHGWVIKRVERTSELRGDCQDFMPAYDIWGFYGFFSNSKDDNSEDLWSVIIDAVADHFNRGQLLIVNGIGLSHTGLQFPILPILRAGQEMLHFAGGRLEFTFGD